MLKPLVKLAALATLALSLTGCVPPSLSAPIQVDSKFSMPPELASSLRAMPDWGDKIAVVALDEKQADSDESAFNRTIDYSAFASSFSFSCSSSVSEHLLFNISRYVHSQLLVVSTSR